MFRASSVYSACDAWIKSIGQQHLIVGQLCRGGDGEFQALQACARASMQLGCEPTGLLAKGVEMEALLKSTRYFDGLCV